MVLIHGVGDDAKTWKRILLEPRDSWLKPVRLYAVDLPGSGKTPPPANSEGYRVRKLAETLRSALSEVKECQRWMVVGNSLGGWVGTWLTVDWKDNVNKLVLVGSAALKA